jgi:signal transduction histidine kinase
VRRRLTLAIVLVAAGAVTLFALPLGVVLHNSYRDEELLRLQRDTVAAARLIDLGTTAGDPVELPHGSDLLVVYDAAGRRVAASAAAGPAHADPVVADAIALRRPTTRTGGGRLVAAVPLLTGERVTGAIRAQRTSHAVETRAHRAWLMLAAAAVGVVLLALIAALLLGRRLARPLERVAVAARRLGDGDFSVRAPRGAIAEVDAVADALDLSAARLGDLVNRERSFSADASHQLRTPLAALRLELEAMQLSSGPAVEVDRAVDEIDRLEQTIQTLLAVARDAPRADVSCEIAAVVAEAEARWHGRLAAEGRRLMVDAPTDRMSVRAARAVIEEILDVLLDNALTHGSGVVSIALRAIDDEWVAVELSDQGSGFPQPAEAAFQRRSGGRDGHGIGLALARSLAHAEGGRLSIVGAGHPTVLTLTLRRAHATEPGPRAGAAD